LDVQLARFGQEREQLLKYSLQRLQRRKLLQLPRGESLGTLDDATIARINCQEVLRCLRLGSKLDLRPSLDPAAASARAGEGTQLPLPPLLGLGPSSAEQGGSGHGSVPPCTAAAAAVGPWHELAEGGVNGGDDERSQLIGRQLVLASYETFLLSYNLLRPEGPECGQLDVTVLEASGLKLPHSSSSSSSSSSSAAAAARVYVRLAVGPVTARTTARGPTPPRGGSGTGSGGEDHHGGGGGYRWGEQFPFTVADGCDTLQLSVHAATASPGTAADGGEYAAAAGEQAAAINSTGARRSQWREVGRAEVALAPVLKLARQGGQQTQELEGEYPLLVSNGYTARYRPGGGRLRLGLAFFSGTGGGAITPRAGAGGATAQQQQEQQQEGQPGGVGGEGAGGGGAVGAGGVGSGLLLSGAELPVPTEVLEKLQAAFDISEVEHEQLTEGLLLPEHEDHGVAGDVGAAAALRARLAHMRAVPAGVCMGACPHYRLLLLLAKRPRHFASDQQFDTWQARQLSVVRHALLALLRHGLGRGELEQLVGLDESPQLQAVEAGLRRLFEGVAAVSAHYKTSDGFPEEAYTTALDTLHDRAMEVYALHDRAHALTPLRVLPPPPQAAAAAAAVDGGCRAASDRSEDEDEHEDEEEEVESIPASLWGPVRYPVNAAMYETLCVAVFDHERVGRPHSDHFKDVLLAVLQRTRAQLGVSNEVAHLLLARQYFEEHRSAEEEAARRDLACSSSSSSSSSSSMGGGGGGGGGGGSTGLGTRRQHGSGLRAVQQQERALVLTALEDHLFLSAPQPVHSPHHHHATGDGEMGSASSSLSSPIALTAAAAALGDGDMDVHWPALAGGWDGGRSDDGTAVRQLLTAPMLAHFERILAEHQRCEPDLLARVLKVYVVLRRTGAGAGAGRGSSSYSAAARSRMGKHSGQGETAAGSGSSFALGRDINTAALDTPTLLREVLRDSTLRLYERLRAQVTTSMGPVARQQQQQQQPEEEEEPEASSSSSSRCHRLVNAQLGALELEQLVAKVLEAVDVEIEKYERVWAGKGSSDNSHSSTSSAVALPDSTKMFLHTIGSRLRQDYESCRCPGTIDAEVVQALLRLLQLERRMRDCGCETIILAHDDARHGGASPFSQLAWRWIDNRGQQFRSSIQAFVEYDSWEAKPPARTSFSLEGLFEMFRETMECFLDFKIASHLMFICLVEHLVSACIDYSNGLVVSCGDLLDLVPPQPTWPPIAQYRRISGSSSPTKTPSTARGESGGADDDDDAEATDGDGSGDSGAEQANGPICVRLNNLVCTRHILCTHMSLV
jgi:hypothetical protein